MYAYILLVRALPSNVDHTLKATAVADVIGWVFALRICFPLFVGPSCHARCVDRGAGNAPLPGKRQQS